CGRPSTFGNGLEVWLNPGHQAQAANVLALPGAPLPETTGTTYRANPILIAVLSFARTARPRRGRKMCFCVVPAFPFLPSVNTHAPLNLGLERARRSAGIEGGAFCIATLGAERSRYREKMSWSSYGPDSHSCRKPRLRVSRRLIFQSSWMYVPTNGTRIVW